MKKNVEEMKIPKRVRKSFTILHDKHLKKYKEIEFFPTLFEKGRYNCVTSSILYSMVFEELKIPYKIQATKNHVYLVANPGPSSIVVETTNPNIDKKEYLEDYKRDYVSHLRSIKLISEKEYKSKSINEIFEEKTNNVWTAEFNNLVGFQYYNLGLVKFSNKEAEEAYKLFQKAYFFNPDKQVQLVLYGVLLQLVSNSKYENVSDIDYIAQLSRYKDINFEFTKKTCP
jgi:tetratricopeptide (TPR) repeat protein